MVKKILEKAGFIENETYKKVRFAKPPDTTYCVYLLSIDAVGSDKKRFADDVHCEIEMYSKDIPDTKSETRLISLLDEFYENLTDGYEVDGWLWLNELNVYQNIFRFDYIQKI